MLFQFSFGSDKDLPHGEYLEACECLFFNSDKDRTEMILFNI
jgi:hypothetical protein